jgi:hypothetical protein
MWTVVRFELRRASDYRAAFDLLAAAGFAPHRLPAPDSAEPFPAAVVRDLFQDPAVVGRAVFEALDEAGLSPIGIASAHVDVGRGVRRRAALARR